MVNCQLRGTPVFSTNLLSLTGDRHESSGQATRRLPRPEVLRPVQPRCEYQLLQLSVLICPPVLNQLVRRDSLQAFFPWLESGKPETNVPVCWDVERSLCKSQLATSSTLAIHGVRLAYSDACLGREVTVLAALAATRVVLGRILSRTGLQITH